MAWSVLPRSNTATKVGGGTLMARIVLPGKPSPLGETFDGSGVNFALFSEHATKVELCLFDTSAKQQTEIIEVK
jgi:isoamylase